MFQSISVFENALFVLSNRFQHHSNMNLLRDVHLVESQIGMLTPKGMLKEQSPGHIHILILTTSGKGYNTISKLVTIFGIKFMFHFYKTSNNLVFNR